MHDPEIEKYLQTNKAMWNEYVGINSHSAMYNLDAFRQGANMLNSVERDEVGDVKGKTLLHLQCHFGMDTLSWARLGAQVTGMDFSDEGIKLAKKLSEDLSIPGRFVCCDLYDLPQALPAETFDIVFTSYGALCWLPDIKRWAEIAASYVKPGGFLYIAEFHPFALVFDDESEELRFRYPYYEKMMSFDVEGSYADRNAQVSVKRDYEWNHTMGEIVTGLIDAGLRIEYLHEYPFSVYGQLAMLRPDGKGYWHFPDGAKPIPLMYSLKASKE